MAFQSANVVITGGSIGIGRQLALDLVGKGAKVLVCARNVGPLNQLKAEEPKIATQVCDVTKTDNVAELRDAVQTTLGGVDYLFNSAALFRLRTLTDTALTEDDWQAEFDVNVKGTLRVTQAFLPAMLAANTGTIINFTSPAGYVPLTEAPFYSATKAAITSWTKSLRHQLRNTGVTAIEISPPVVATRMNENNPTSEGRKKWKTPDFTSAVIRQLDRKAKKDIYVGDGMLVKRMHRIAPGMVFKQVNPA